MRSINIREYIRTDSKNEEKLVRILRNINSIYQIGKFGSKALSKINPALIVADAVISVLDAFSSYLKYRKAIEITRQLEIELSKTKEYYEVMKSHFNELLKTEEIFLNTKVEETKAKIFNNEKIMINMRKIYDQSGIHLQTVGQKIREFKKEYFSDEELRKLEQKYLEAIHLRIKMTFFILGG